MQSRNNDGTLGDIMPFDEEAMKREIEKEHVSHVEVFNGIPSEIAKRQAALAKQRNEEPKRKKKRKLQKQSRKNNR